MQLRLTSALKPKQAVTESSNSLIMVQKRMRCIHQPRTQIFI